MALPSYDTVHRHLAEQRGRARDKTCSCGRAAEGWAYQHTAEVELRDREGHVYSANLDDYVAMCTLCHTTLDRVIDRPRRGDEVLVELQPRGSEEPLAELRRSDPEAYRELRRQAGQASTQVRRKCNECPMVAHAGNLARHQKASGHAGWTAC